MSNLLWSRGEVGFFQYPKLSMQQKLTHMVFLRHGGVSAPPFNTLNTSYKVGDRPGDVSSNLRKIKNVMGARDLMFMNQSHGVDILVLGKDHLEKSSETPSADAMITDMAYIALIVKLADCQGIIIYDPKKKVVANVHCGWRGNVHNIVGKTVTRMNDCFGCRGSDLLAAIGPSLGPCCAEFIDYEAIFPGEFKDFMVRENYFDLWAVTRRQLLEAGLKEENIEVAGICTRCNSDMFFSYRAEGQTGRFGIAAMLVS